MKKTPPIYTSPILQEFFGKELTKDEQIETLAKMVQEVCDKNDDLLKALIRAKERIEYDNNPSQSEYCKSVLREINEAIKKATE